MLLQKHFFLKTRGSFIKLIVVQKAAFGRMLMQVAAIVGKKSIVCYIKHCCGADGCTRRTMANVVQEATLNSKAVRLNDERDLRCKGLHSLNSC